MRERDCRERMVVSSTQGMGRQQTDSEAVDCFGYILLEVSRAQMEQLHGGKPAAVPWP